MSSRAFDNTASAPQLDATACNKRGNALREQGEHAAALACYEQALALEPQHAAALYNRGNVLLLLDRPHDALESFDRVLALSPDDAEALSNRGNALLDLKRPQDALASYDRAVAIDPGLASALYNRGNALMALKRFDEAVAAYDRALARAPLIAEAHSNRGLALHELRRFEDAVASYDAALALRADDPSTLYNRANALQSLRRHHEAIASYDRALELEPAHADALHNRGNALRDLKRLEEAVASYDRAIALRPNAPETFNNRGAVLFELQRREEALASFGQALALDPDSAEALNNHANALTSLGRHAEAAGEFARALELDPELPFAAGMLVQSRLHCCDWRTLKEDVVRVISGVCSGRSSAAPFDFLAMCGSPESQRRCAQTWVKVRCPPSATPLWRGEHYHHGRIRIAYLSSDFRDHPVACLVAGLFERHDRSRFETIAISFGPEIASEMSARLRRSFERFIDVRKRNDREVAELLRELEIDIAIDLNGYTANHRTPILAWRAVPVQVNYLGYPGTMGADYIDYILADRLVIPQEQRVHYVENVVNLPDSFQVNDDQRQMADRIPTRTEAGLPVEGFVFCSFNNNYKIAPDVFDVWMRLLRRVDGSVLWLQETNAVSSRNLRREAQNRGIAPERLVFAGKTPKLEDHLARYRLADLFLDTLPYNAHTTASDALWAGVPVLTCMGDAYAARVAGSLLHAVGFPELITHSLPEYEKLALMLAQDATLLSGKKEKLERNRDRCSLFDTDRFRRYLEAAYTMMWERHQRGEAPVPFDVAATEQ